MMGAICVKLLEQRMESFLSGVFFDWESRCDELMVINDAVSGDVYLPNYAFKLFLGQVSMALLHGRPQLFKLNCTTMVHINLVEFSA